MQKQILEYIEKHLSPQLCGFRRGYNTQTALIFALENGHYPQITKVQSIIDNKGFAGGILMDLSKAFDTINHTLMLACLWIQPTGCSYNTQLFVKPKRKDKDQ